MLTQRAEEEEDKQILAAMRKTTNMFAAERDSMIDLDLKNKIKHSASFLKSQDISLIEKERSDSPDSSVVHYQEVERNLLNMSKDSFINDIIGYR